MTTWNLQQLEEFCRLEHADERLVRLIALRCYTDQWEDIIDRINQRRRQRRHEVFLADCGQRASA